MCFRYSKFCHEIKMNSGNSKTIFKVWTQGTIISCGNMKNTFNLLIFGDFVVSQSLGSSMCSKIQWDKL
jgi:hypothetical protein